MDTCWHVAIDVIKLGNLAAIELQIRAGSLKVIFPGRIDCIN